MACAFRQAGSYLGFGRQFRRDYGVWVSEKSSSKAVPEWLTKLSRR
jgi:hypothetical protein